jgi:enoyl-CoA hydratase/carnithine racemase
MTYTCFKLDALSPSLWRATFSNPPINLIDVRMIADLRELFARIERDEGPAVLIFDSADPDYFLAHFDISPANLAELASLPPGPTGLHPWLDILVRLSMLPAVTISAIRGRARGAGSEFALASDMRFASRERAVLGQFEVGFGAIPGGGPASWLPRLVGRGRALEILFCGEDFNGELAERYGYVNRAIPDGDFDSFVHRLARRVSTFDREALADIKYFVNKVSLPNMEEEFPPHLDAFMRAAAGPRLQARARKAFEQGFQARSDVELRLAAYIGEVTEAEATASTRPTTENYQPPPRQNAPLSP